jgi:Protein of unknown function (DUF2971)
MTASIHAGLNEVLWEDLPEETLFPASRPLLAHYTSVEVLEKILAHNEMWFSNPLYMNDWEELQYGMNTGASQFLTNSHLIEASGSAEVHGKLVACFDQLFYDFDTKHAIDTYVLCFSKHSPENNDGLLSMWRGYGARGSGVALVIDTAKQGVIEHSPLILGIVHYASHSQRLEWIDSKLAQLAEIVRAQPKTDENLYYVAHSWIERLKLFSLFTKHDGFSEEQEWRVVYMSERETTNALSSMLGYLVTARGVEPKLKLKLTVLPGVVDSSVSIEVLTDRIILGPSISTVLAENSVRKMLRLNGKASLAERVVASSIPYRS